MSSVTDSVYEAQKERRKIGLLTETYGSFDIDQAYLYQDELVERFISEGRKMAGYKLALASRAKIKQMGIDSPIHGVLFKDMNLTDFRVAYSKLNNPKAEPEIAIKISDDIPANASESEVEACIGFIAPAIEIPDSRYESTKLTAEDLVADNCSAAQFAIGEWLPYDPEHMNLTNIKVSFVINGEEIASGKSSAVLGSPLAALCELNRSLASQGKALLKDQTVLTGAIVAACDIKPGDTIANITDILGELTLR